MNNYFDSYVVYNANDPIKAGRIERDYVFFISKNGSFYIFNHKTFSVVKTYDNIEFLKECVNIKIINKEKEDHYYK